MANLDGSSRRIIIHTGHDTVPRGLVISHTRRYLSLFEKDEYALSNGGKIINSLLSSIFINLNMGNPIIAICQIKERRFLKLEEH